MQSNYKRLGDYIRQVDVRNRDLAVTKLRGLSMTKQFRESTSNIIGVDLSKYKIVYPGVFAFDTMSVIRVHKVPIVLNYIGYPVIISPAYITFEISRKSELDEDFLFLFFKTTEFDRYADFKSDASVRGGYNWEELCDTQVPVPPIVEQRKIVAEYQAVERRIENNRRLIATLEATAQTIYRKMFVDNIDPNNIPQGWRMGVLGDVINISSGKSLSDKVDSPNNKYKYPVAGASGIIGYSKESNQSERFLTTGRVGTIGVVNRYLTPAWTADNVLVVKSDYYEYAYQVLLGVNYQELIGGGVQNLITQSGLSNVEMLIPPLNRVLEFENCVESISKLSDNLRNENILLYAMHSLLLTKLSKI